MKDTYTTPQKDHSIDSNAPSLLDSTKIGEILARCTPPRNKGNPFNRFFAKKKTSVVVYTVHNGEIADVELEQTKLLNRASSKFNIPGHSPMCRLGTTPRKKNKPHSSLTTENTQTTLRYVHSIVDTHNQILAVYADVDDDDETNALFEQIVEELLNKHRDGEKTTKEKVYDSENAPSFISVPHRDQNKVMKKKARDVTKQIFNIKAILQAFDQMDLSKEQKKAILLRFKEFCAEWLHLVDYAKMGKKGQIPENLVYGSKDANTMMMIIEAYTNIKVEKDEKIKITVTAEDIQKDIPQKIVIRIEKENAPKYLQITIDPLGNTKPLVQSIQYFQLQQSLLEKLAASSM